MAYLLHTIHEKAFLNYNYVVILILKRKYYRLEIKHINLSEINIIIQNLELK